MFLNPNAPLPTATKSTRVSNLHPETNRADALAHYTPTRAGKRFHAYATTYLPPGFSKALGNLSTENQDLLCQRPTKMVGKYPNDFQRVSCRRIFTPPREFLAAGRRPDGNSRGILMSSGVIAG